MDNMEIRVEYTGVEPNMRPAANAFARAIRNHIDPDGTFTDPELESEFQEWMKSRKEIAS